jgi:glycosyltransferase involved in cell wall biosynthesis
MSAPHIRVFQEDREIATAASPAWAILTSSYCRGATQGNRLGSAGYSYDFLASQFVPVLNKLGSVVAVRNPWTQLRTAIKNAHRQGLVPVHLSFLPFQDVCLTDSVPSVVVPAWEFPDVPNASFDGNPQNNWVETANRCSLVMAGGPFIANTLEAAGVKTPIRIVPVPTPETYFQMPRWQSDHGITLDCSPYVLPEANASSMAPSSSATHQSRHETMRVWGLQAYRHLVKPCLPCRMEAMTAAMLHAGMSAWQEPFPPRRNPLHLDLGGIVYTSIFNPADDRKNWEDTITAFLKALGDCDDATLVLKLVTEKPQAIQSVLSFYRRLDVPHRCRVMILPDFLTEADMLQLVRASSYYLTSTRAEGYCLPLMHHLAAGRPCISPSHTAISDYFNSEMGFVVESHPEPCNWPQDSRKRWRTTRHRLVWTSLVDQIRQSYRIVKEDPAAYAALADAAQEGMRRWSHPDVVWPRLHSAFELLESPVNMTTRENESQINNSEPDRPRIISIESERTRRGQRRLMTGINRPQVKSQKTRVVVSLLSFRPGEIGGTETYLRQLIARLPHMDRCSEIVLLMDRDLASQNLFPDIERTVVDLSAKQVLRERALEALTPYRSRVVEKTLNGLQPDVVFFPQQSIFPKKVTAPCVLVVHDLYHLVLPQYLMPLQRIIRRRSYAYSVFRADRIIAISGFTKKTILENYRVDPRRITVVHHGWMPNNAALVSDSNHNGGYLYYPAITRPHKNHQALFESIAALKSQGRFDKRLILSGIQTSHWKKLRKQIKRLHLEETVQHEGYVSYERVRQLYQGADCVVFPTMFEGFGLPVMEAIEARKKILVSHLEVFDEIGVPQRFQIDFADPEQLYRGLQEPGVTVLEHQPLTWDESAAATMAVLGILAEREAIAESTIARAA